MSTSSVYVNSTVTCRSCREHPPSCAHLPKMLKQPVPEEKVNMDWTGWVPLGTPSAPCSSSPSWLPSLAPKPQDPHAELGALLYRCTRPICPEIANYNSSGPSAPHKTSRPGTLPYHVLLDSQNITLGPHFYLISKASNPHCLRLPFSFTHEDHVRPQSPMLSDY